MFAVPAADVMVAVDPVADPEMLTEPLMMLHRYVTDPGVVNPLMDAA
jgi:hypothetical protein